MRRNRLFGWMIGLTSAALTAMAAAAPVMASVSENVPGGGNSGNGERVEEAAKEKEDALRERQGAEAEENAPAAQDGEADAGTKGVYEFPDTKTAGTMTIVEKWEDQSTNAERPLADISISTQKPGKNPLGYTVTFHADAKKRLTFADGVRENEVVYNRSGQAVSGVYKGLVGGSSIVWWYTDKTYKEQIVLDENGQIAGALAGDMDAWPKEVTFEVNSGGKFNRAVPNTATAVIFTDEEMPKNTTPIDVDADGDGGVIAWTEENETVMKVSSQIKGVKVQAAKISGSMFRDKSNIQTIDFTNFNTSQVINMDFMFYGCRGLVSLDVPVFDTNKVKSMFSMFRYCGELTSLDLLSFDTVNVTNMGFMFDGCSSLTSLDMSAFNTTNVTNMSGMFSGCSKMTSLDMSAFNTTNVTNMSQMFSGCSSLANLDLSSFDTSRVTNMTFMFSGGRGLISLEVPSFDTTNVTSMGGMFEGCSSLTRLDVSAFDTTNVTYLGSMFSGCRELANLEVSTFDTTAVTYMNSMFAGCSSLTRLDVSAFDTSQVTNMKSMFSNCNALTNLTTGVSFKFIGADYSLAGTGQNTAGETFTSGNIPNNVADIYTRID